MKKYHSTKGLNSAMFKFSAYMLLPFMLANLTIAENRWTIFDLHPDQFIYAATIGLAWYAGAFSRYSLLVTIMLVLAIAMRLLETLGGNASLREVSFAALAVVFAVAGAVIYGRNPLLLHKQLVIYLALCIPIMFLQILGVSSLLMGWNIGYLHDPSVMNIDDVGSFKDIPVYPTLFVGIDDLEFSTGQGRPVGLMYAANPLSVFISIAVAINLAITRASRIRFSDIVVTIAIVLAMSKLSFGVAILLYAGFLVFGGRERRLLALKLIIVLAMVMFLYYLLFPGLLITNFSEGMVMGAIMLRLVDLLKALGIENYFGQLDDLAIVYRQSYVYVVGEGYSAVATLLRSKLLILSLFAMMVGVVLYVRRVQDMASRPAMVYVVTLLACILTQFAVPFVGAASFQLIMGFALFPLFRKMWVPAHIKVSTEPPVNRLPSVT